MSEPDIMLFGEEEILAWMRRMPNEFAAWINQEYDRQVTELSNASDMFHVGRCQGRMAVLTLLNKLRREA